MEEALVQYLLGAIGLTSLIGQRADWAIRPQASLLPQLVLHTIDSAPYYSDEGESGLFSARVQVDCWDRTYAGAKTIARQVLSRLSGAVFTQGPVTFQLSHAEDQQDDFEIGAGDEEFYRTRLDFIVIFKQ